MKKHFLSITLLLAPAAMFAMDADGEQGVVQELIAAAPRKKSNKQQKAAALAAAQEEEQDEQVEDAQGVVGEEASNGPASAVTAATQAAPTEEQRDEKLEAAYQRGVLGSIGLALTGYDRTAYVQSYFRCNARCKTACNHPITIPENMLVQLANDRNKAIMTEQTEAIKTLRGQNNGSIPGQHNVQKSIHSGPIQKLGALVKGSNQTDNFKLSDVRPVKRVDQLLRNEDAADLQLLADAYDMVQARMEERKAIRANLNAQKPKESDIVLSDTEYGDDDQFVEKFQGYRNAKKAAEKAAKK